MRTSESPCYSLKQKNCPINGSDSDIENSVINLNQCRNSSSSDCNTPRRNPPTGNLVLDQDRKFVETSSFLQREDFAHILSSEGGSSASELLTHLT